ncbi:bifunctional lysine ketoglutarate reductase /saccharopine dehydrogenase family protein [Acidobacteriota bacterium]
MNKRIGIRKEDKNPWERRSPLIPSHVKELIQKSNVDVDIQSSPNRIFSDEEFTREGARIVDSLRDCPVIFAVKEIPPHLFEQNKVYIFFSHTIKGQSKNMPMLKKMIDLKCTLIDYERIIDENGLRLVFFGRQAGQVGMIDTLWALGQRWDAQGIRNPFSSIKQAFNYPSLVAAKEEVSAVGWTIKNHGLNPALVPLVCGFTGYGRVSQGAQEIFSLLPSEELLPGEIEELFKAKDFASNRLYKVVFKEEHMVEPIQRQQDFDLQDYYDCPEKYQPVFERYVPYLTILVNCIYWAPQYPRLVTRKFLNRLWTGVDPPRLHVIGDISCDQEGAIECTVKTTSQDNPVFVFDPLEGKTVDGYEGRGVVILATDNLPTELPLESSIFFSQSLKPLVPAIANADFSGSFDKCALPNSVKKAVILYRGQFTPDYEYMNNFISVKR